MTFAPPPDATPPPPAVPPNGVVRVPVSAPKPSVTAFAKTVVRFATGAMGDDFVNRFDRLKRGSDAAFNGTGPVTDAPLRERETGAAYLFDAPGFRLVGSKEVSLSIAWTELARVALQIQTSEMLGLKMLRLVWWPVDLRTFVAQHPECGALWEPTQAGCATAIATGQTIPPDRIELARSGLVYAGNRYDGQVTAVSTTQ